MEPQNETQLINAVGEWSNKNFGDRRAPELGVAEEIGEAIHCVLKRKQMIRGFENEDFFLSQLTDAFADCIIFLCDWCSMRDAFFSFNRNLQDQPPLTIDHQDKIIVHMLQGAAAIIAHGINFSDSVIEKNIITNMLAQRIVNGLELWAGIYKIDLKLAVSAVWANVSKRDWQKNPENADKILV